MTLPFKLDGERNQVLLRVVPWTEERRGRLQYEGALADVVFEIERRERLGWIADWPYDKSWLCEWCNGYGDPTGQLTVHSLELQVAQ